MPENFLLDALKIYGTEYLIGIWSQKQKGLSFHENDFYRVGYARWVKDPQYFLTN